MNGTETGRIFEIGFSEQEMLNATPYEATLLLAKLDGIPQEREVIINAFNLFTISIKDIRDILMRKINQAGLVG